MVVLLVISEIITEVFEGKTKKTESLKNDDQLQGTS